MARYEVNEVNELPDYFKNYVPLPDNFLLNRENMEEKPKLTHDEFNKLLCWSK